MLHFPILRVGWRSLLRALAIALAASLSLPAAAYACNPGRGSQNDYPTSHSKGWILDPTISGNTWENVFARMIVKDPYVYHVSGIDNTFWDNGSYPWIMLVAPSSGALAQFGPFVDNNGTHWAFGYCFSAGKGPTEILDSEKPVGYSVADEVKVDSGGKKTFYEDGSSKGSCDYTFSALEAQAAGEVRTISDQIPGIPTGHETWTGGYVTDDNGIQKNLFSSNGSPGSSNPGSWIGFSESNTANTMDVWDNGC